MAPYTAEFEGDDDAWDTSKGVRVLGVAFVPDYDQAAFAALIGPDGDCSEHLRIPHLLKRKSSYNPEDAQLKEADHQVDGYLEKYLLIYFGLVEKKPYAHAG